MSKCCIASVLVEVYFRSYGNISLAFDAYHGEGNVCCDCMCTCKFWVHLRSRTFPFVGDRVGADLGGDLDLALGDQGVPGGGHVGGVRSLFVWGGGRSRVLELVFLASS